MSEPPGCGGGTEISERSIEHYTSGSFVNNKPCSTPCGEGVTILLFRTSDAPSRTGTRATQFIVIEGEGGLVRTLGNIGFHASAISTGEIACFRVGHPNVSHVCIVGHCALQLHATVKHFSRLPAIPRLIAVNGSQRTATGEHSAHPIYVLCIEVFQVERSQTGATGEHFAHPFYVLCIEVRQVQRSQTRATGEHTYHAGYVFCIEVRQVQRSQTRAISEHRSHVSDVLGVEVRHIQRGQTGATEEHPTHVSDVLGVEIFHPFDLLERTTIVEPPVSGGGTEISERDIKHHARGGRIYLKTCSCPSGVGTIITPNILSFPNPPCRAGAGGTQVIVVEGEGRPVRTFVHIGLAGLRQRTLRRSEQETNQCEEHRTTIT